MLLFVYGTLQRGESNHGQLAGAKFVQRASTDPEFELVDLGGFPALLEDGNTAVRGELYEVAPERLAALDAFEEVPVLYMRKSIRVGGQLAEAYVMRRDQAGGARRIDDGNWRRERARSS